MLVVNVFFKINLLEPQPCLVIALFHSLSHDPVVTLELSLHIALPDFPDVGRRGGEGV